MTKQTFDVEVARLIDVYGEEHYSAERRRVFWQFFSEWSVTDADFHRAIDLVILNDHRPAMGPQIRRRVEEVWKARGLRLFEAGRD